MAPTLAYFRLRSLGHPIRLLLTYVGQEYEEKIYETGPAPDFDKTGWWNDKYALNLDFPNLPYYIDGDLRLSQSSAIMHYLARKHNLDGKTEEEKIRIDLLEPEIIDIRSNFYRMCYSGDKYEEMKVEFVKSLPIWIKQISAFLGDRKFFVGDRLTFVDFYAYEIIYQLLHFDRDLIKDYANLKHFYDRFEAIPQLTDFIKNAPISKTPINNKMAVFGNVFIEP